MEPKSVLQPASRRGFLCGCTTLTAAGFFATTRLAAAEAASPVLAPRSAPPANRAPLAPQPFQLLPTGSIAPAGWLRRQLEIQAHGLGGHLDEFWPDVGPNSGWLGGTGESWERGPYFLDGLLPLAWQLNDPVLKAKAQKFIDWTLDHPWENGNIGPKSNDDWWPRMVILKVLTQYHELTNDPRVIPFMTNYFHYQLANMPGRPLFDWGRMRWQDNLVSVVWLYNRTGDAKLLELAKVLQAQGFNWQGMFANFKFTHKLRPSEIGIDEVTLTEDPSTRADLALQAHGVNNAQALKVGPVWSQITGAPVDRDFINRQLATLDKYHGLPNGMFAADEHLAGTGPSQGIELCAVVEAMYSLEYGLAVTGEAALGDRIEKIAYNALPGTFTDDMWAHQYDQQPNQVQVSVARGPWTTNGPESNLFGLEPHFGCCTANFHQGWPKLVSSLWMASDDDGLAATIYAPCEVDTVVRGVPVRLSQATDYPFRNTMKITVTPQKPVSFPMRLRVPAWATASTIRVNGKIVHATVTSGFAKIDREWRAGDRVDLAFVSHPKAVQGHNGSISFEDGPLVFSLPIEEQWKKLRPRGMTNDWEVFPASNWAYGVTAATPMKRVERPIGNTPFSRVSPPVLLIVEGQAVAGWTIVEGSAADVPEQAVPAGKVEPLVLMPYGAPKLRLTAFAVLKA